MSLTSVGDWESTPLACGCVASSEAWPHATVGTASAITTATSSAPARPPVLIPGACPATSPAPPTSRPSAPTTSATMAMVLLEPPDPDEPAPDVASMRAAGVSEDSAPDHSTTLPSE